MAVTVSVDICVPCVSMEIFLISMKLLAEFSSHQHQDSTVMVLANQPSYRIALAQDVCQVGVLQLVIVRFSEYLVCLKNRLVR